MKKPVATVLHNARIIDFDPLRGWEGYLGRYRSHLAIIARIPVRTPTFFHQE
jgi:hypothetical protein